MPVKFMVKSLEGEKESGFIFGMQNERGLLTLN